MKAQQIRAPVLLCAMLCLAAAGVATLQQNAAPTATPAIASATVADIKGEVQVELPGQGTTAPSLGQILPAETVVNTQNGRLLLRLEDGSHILVYSNTRMVLKQPSPTNWQRLQLLLGKIKAEIQKRVGGSSSFQVGTPSATISVRGTRVYVEVDKHKLTRVFVEQGEVEVENAKGIGKPVRIKAGFSSRVGEDSAPEPPQEAPGLGRQPGDNKGSGRNEESPGAGQHGNPPAPRGGKKPP
jgi:hypothetical protein